MRSIQAVGVGDVRLLDLPGDDAPPAPAEVCGTTVATLVSPGTELAVVGQAGGFPKGLGYAAVFRVDAVGDAIVDLAPGSLAFCYGPHASTQRQPRARVFPVPAGLAPETAVFARLMAVGMSTLTTTAARPPERVVVTGLGPVGCLAAQVFAACGYAVVGVDPDPGRRALAASLGVEALEAAPAEDPRGPVALGLECSGHEAAALALCRLVRRRGEVVLVGVPWGRRADLQAHDLLHAVFHRYVVLRSGWEWEVPFDPTDFRAGSLSGNAAAALAWLADGRVRADGLARAAAPADCGAVYAALGENAFGAPTAWFDWR